MGHQLKKAEIRATKLSRDEFAAAPRLPVRFILDSLKVAANVGTILRLSDAIMAEHVYICGNTIQSPSYKLKQASIGAARARRDRGVGTRVRVAGGARERNVPAGTSG